MREEMEHDGSDVRGSESTRASSTGAEREMAEGWVWLHLHELREDPENVRRRMDRARLEELAASIREHGVRQPLEVVRAGQGRYQVVTGNRRLRASRLLVDALERECPVDVELVSARSRVPCRILGPEDAERAKELQLIENLQREEMSPVDEAAGFAWLLEHHAGWGMADVARRIGCSSEHVEARLKLGQAPAALLEAIEEGLVGVTVGELVGRLPGEDIRQEVTRRVLAPAHRETPMSAEEAERLVRTEYVLPLKEAPFDPTREGLAGVGACATCPKESGNMEGARESGRKGVRGHGRGRCTDAQCYRRKGAAWWDMERRQAEESGVTVLEADAARRVYAGPFGSVAVRSEWVDLEDRPGPEDVGHHDVARLPLWVDLVEGLGVPEAVARHPETGQVRRLVRRELAVEAVNRRAETGGEASPFRAMSEEMAAKLAEGEERKRRARLRKGEGVALLRRVWERLEGGDADEMEVVWEILASAALEDRERLEVMAALCGVVRPPGAGRSWREDGIATAVPLAGMRLALMLLAGPVLLDGAEAVVLREVADALGLLAEAPEVPGMGKTVHLSEVER